MPRFLLSKLISDNKDKIFTVQQKTYPLVIKNIYIYQSNDQDASFAIAELTDGDHWIPAVVAIPTLMRTLDGDSVFDHLDTLQGGNIFITEFMPYVYRRGKGLAVSLTIMNCNIPRSAPGGSEQGELEDICLEPSVNQWLIEMQKTITGFDDECIKALYPKKHKRDIQPFLDELHEIYKVVELHVLRMYGELPLRPVKPSKIVQRKRTVSGEFKNQKSTSEVSGSENTQDEELTAHPQLRLEPKPGPTAIMVGKVYNSADIRQMWEDMTTVDVINCIIPPEQQKKLDEGQEDLAMRNDARERDPPNLPTNIVGNVALSDLTESNRSKALSSPPARTHDEWRSNASDAKIRTEKCNIVNDDTQTASEEPMPSDKTLIPAYLRSLYVTMVRSIVHSTP